MRHSALNQRVSVVINTLNRAKDLRIALRALELQRFKDFEVVVVPGPCTDDTLKVLQDWSGRLKLVQCNEANLSKSRNIGISNCAGNIVAFMDDDAIPEPDWLEHICDAFLDPRVAAVGGYIRDHTGYTFQCRKVLCNRFGDAVFEGESDAAPSLSDSLFISTTGANCAFRRSVLFEVGGFDEHYAYFLEETDLDLRIHDLGYEISSCPEAEVLHKYAASDSRRADRIPTTIYKSVFSKTYFCIKNSREMFETINAHLDQYCAHLKEIYLEFQKRKLIDDAHLAKLYLEIDTARIEGTKAGRYQERRLRYDLNEHPTSFLPFNGRHQPMKAHRCAIVHRPTVDLKDLIQKTLNSTGHETTHFAFAEQDVTTVDFNGDAWLHIIPIGPDDQRNLTAQVRELTRAHFRRGFDVVYCDAKTGPLLQRLGFTVSISE
jgi:glycogen(starch) synthase